MLIYTAGRNAEAVNSHIQSNEAIINKSISLYDKSQYTVLRTTYQILSVRHIEDVEAEFTTM